MRPRYPIPIPPRRPKKPAAQILNWQNPKNLVFIVLVLAMIPAAVLLVNALVGGNASGKGRGGATSSANRVSPDTAATPVEAPLRCIGDALRVANVSVEPADSCCVAVLTGEVQNTCNKGVTAAVAGKLHDIRSGRVVGVGATEFVVSLDPGDSAPFSIDVDLRTTKSWEMLKRNELYPRSSVRIGR